MHLESRRAKCGHGPIDRAHVVNDTLRSRRSHGVAAFSACQNAQIRLNRRIFAHGVGDDLGRGFGAESGFGFGANLRGRLRSNARERIGLGRRYLRERGDGCEKQECWENGQRQEGGSRFHARCEPSGRWCREAQEPLLWRTGLPDNHCSVDVYRGGPRVPVRLDAVEHRVGHARDLGHFGDIVNANDMRAAQDGGRHGGRCAPETLGDRRHFGFPSLRPAD